MPDRAPLVGVVMRVYNDGPFVNEAVASIWGQSFGDFEFVIVVRQIDWLADRYFVETGDYIIPRLVRFG